MTNLQRKINTFLLYGLGFLLLWEWLIPLETVSDTQNADIFVGFVALSLLLSFWKGRFWLSALAKTGYVVFTLNSLFFQKPFLSFAWFSDLIADCIHNFYFLINFQGNEMTDSFRSFLFFLLLWIMTYLLRYWLFVQKKLFLFYAITVGYVAVLDTFTAYSAKVAIVRLVVIGFLLLNLLHNQKLKETEHIKVGTGKWSKPFVVLLCLSLLIGYAAPKLSPQWPDPIPFIKSYASGKQQTEEDALAAKVKKVGYGTNDSRLGGPFIADDTGVFMAEASKRHYWRVETKDIYTGKGWKSTESVAVKTFEKENNVLHWFEKGVDKETLTARVNFLQRYPHLVYPAGLKSISAHRDVVFRLQAATEKIYSTDRSSYAVPLGEYEVTYEYPTFSVKKLKSVQSVQLTQDKTFLQRYTQLPPRLPERVKQLARQITEGKATQYEKVKAVEQYFSENAYFYDTKDVAVPGKNDDYVDQFLFETKRGYCDNYSTSMVVLLRSVGIPARWVKGYTSGQLKDTKKDDKNVYEITNNNAHSWVEVYFAGVGWVPFEPTKGFSNPYQFTEPSTQVEQPSVPQNIQREREQNPLNEEKKSEAKPSTGSLQSIKEMFASLSFKNIVLFFTALLILISLLYKARRKWWPFFTILSFKYRRNEQVFIKAYLSLLKHLDDYGLKRKKGQTLRDYAAYVDEWFMTDEMSQLTFLYEKAVYRRDSFDGEWEQAKKLWENLIKRTAS